MNISKFKNHLDDALKLLVEITKQYCYNNIAETFVFIIQPSGTDFHDGLNDFEKTNLAILNRYVNKHLSFDKVISLLHHDNKVPLWIDTTVYESKKDLTVIHLFCSRRLRADNELNYSAVKYPPFNISVPVPSDFLQKDIDGKYDINWKKKLDRKQTSGNIFVRLKRLFTF
jgi:hypothetical protein